MLCKHCNDTYDGTKVNHYRKCKVYQSHIENVIKILTKEYLTNEYVINLKSASEIASDLGLEKTRIINSKLDEYGIHKRSSPKEFANNPRREQKIKETSLKKYGTNHHLSDPNVIQKRINTNLETYGIENVFQSELIKAKIKETNLVRYGVENIIHSPFHIQKIKSTNTLKYGVENPWLSPDIQRKCLATKIANGNSIGFVSKASQSFIWKVYNLLPENIQKNCYFHELNKEFGIWSADSYWCYDFVIPCLKYCFEYNGTYYHADPRFYPDSWVNKKLNLSARDIWNRDYDKTQILRDKGFIVDIVWQHDDSDEEVNKIVSKILRISDSVEFT